MLVNLMFQDENHGVLHWKHGKSWRETVSPMFHVTFPCEKHGFKHGKWIGKHTGNASLVYSRIIQCVNTCRINSYALRKTWVLSLLTHVFYIEFHGNIYWKPVFTIGNTCKTERKHRNEHG